MSQSWASIVSIYQILIVVEIFNDFLKFNFRLFTFLNLFPASSFFNVYDIFNICSGILGQLIYIFCNLIG